MERIFNSGVTGYEKVLRYIVYIGFLFLLALFIGGIVWKQGTMQQIPKYKLVPLYRILYGFLEPEKRINYTQWRGGETVIDRNNPDIAWFRPIGSKKWIIMSTDELTDKLVRKQQVSSPTLSSNNLATKQKDGFIFNHSAKTK